MTGFEGRGAIVTGAAQGIGREIARRLLADGARVIGVDLQEEKLAGLAAGMPAHVGRLAVVAGDAASEATAAAACAHALALAGRLDILVNCAGGSGSDAVRDITEMSDQQWDRVIAANLRSTFVFSRAAVPLMRAAGAGRIVNFSSSLTRGVSGPLGTVGARLAYCAAKGAIEAFTRQLAADLRPDGITVNAIIPGFILTEPGARVRDRYDRLPAEIQAVLLGGRDESAATGPADVAAAVAFLLSAAADHVSGAALPVGT